MKYIRTKDGIYEINWFDADDFGDEKGDVHSNCEVINQDNTIEELCDEFVLYDADTKQYCVLEKGFYHRFDEECKKTLHIANRYIYGAIWTDKGLIYVAKMNEKGGLELL